MRVAVTLDASASKLIAHMGVTTSPPAGNVSVSFSARARRGPRDRPLLVLVARAARAVLEAGRHLHGAPTPSNRLCVSVQVSVSGPCGSDPVPLQVPARLMRPGKGVGRAMASAAARRRRPTADSRRQQSRPGAHKAAPSRARQVDSLVISRTPLYAPPIDESIQYESARTRPACAKSAGTPPVCRNTIVSSGAIAPDRTSAISAAIAFAV